MSFTVKLILSILLDIVDFFIGRIIGVGMIGDLLIGICAVIMWGAPGIAAFWELLDPSEQIDGFVPTLTLIALSQMGAKKKKAA